MRERLSILIDQKDHNDNYEVIDVNVDVDVEISVERRIRQLPKVARRQRPHGNAPSRRNGWSTSGRRSRRRRVCVESEGERRVQGLCQPSARGLLWWRWIRGKVGRQLPSVGSVP